MDFHDDHTAFDTMASDEVSHMYVPDSTDDHGIGDDGSTGSSDHTDGGSGDSDGTTVTVNTGGQEVTADATIDIDHDGHNDTAIVQDTEGHHIAVTDTDGDGEADHAALLDDSGHVVDTAHLDSDGNWVQDAAGDSNPYGGPGASIDENPDDGGTAGGGTGTGAGAGDGGSTGSGGDGGTIVIESGGQSMDAQATIDTDHDGHNDTAVVRTADGNHVAFTDSDGDGHADQAVVYGPDGHMIGTAHYDEASGTWIEGAGDGANSGGDAVTQTAGGIGGAGGVGAASDGDGSAASGAGGSDTGGVGTQTAGDTGTASGEQIEVTVGGQSAQVAASYDLDHDGHDETAIVQGPDGTKIAFSDTDGDGDADKAAVYDAAGKLVGTATYNEGSGTWVQDN
jgi:hypothetical protein